MQKIFLCFSLIFLLAACAQGPVTPESVMAKGGDLEVGSIEKAMLEAAEKSSERGEYFKSMQLYTQLVDRVPAKDAYRLRQAEMARRAGELAKAQEFYENYLVQHPDNIEAREGLGLAQLSQGTIGRAVENLQRVTKKDPKRWRAINALGIAYSMQQKFDEALVQYREALNASENNPAILNNLGLALAIKEDYPRAIKSLELAQRYISNDRETDARRIRLNLAMVYGLSGDMDKADATARPLLSESELYNNLGHYAYLAKNKDMAKSYLNMALTNSKEHYEKAWQNLKELQESR